MVVVSVVVVVVEHSTSSEIITLSNNQEITCIAWNPEYHYRIHNSPLLAHILSQENSVHNILSCFLTMRFNIAFPYKPIFCKWFPFSRSCLPKCLLPISPMRVARSAIFIILVISDENYKLQCCASRSFVAFLLLRLSISPNILFRTIFQEKLTPYSFFNARNQISYSCITEDTAAQGPYL